MEERLLFYHEFNKDAFDEIQAELFMKGDLHENSITAFIEFLEDNNVFDNPEEYHRSTFFRYKNKGKIPFYRFLLLCKACRCSPLYFERVTDQWGNDYTPKRPIVLVDEKYRFDLDFALDNWWHWWADYRKIHPEVEEIHQITDPKLNGQNDLLLIDYLQAPIWNDREDLALRKITLGDITLEKMFDKEMDRVTENLNKQIEILQHHLKELTEQMNTMEIEHRRIFKRKIAEMQKMVLNMMESEKQLWNIDNLRTIKQWVIELNDQGLLPKDKFDVLLNLLEKILRMYRGN